MRFCFTTSRIRVTSPCASRRLPPCPRSLAGRGCTGAPRGAAPRARLSAAGWLNVGRRPASAAGRQGVPPGCPCSAARWRPLRLALRSCPLPAQPQLHGSRPGALPPLLRSPPDPTAGAIAWWTPPSSSPCPSAPPLPTGAPTCWCCARGRCRSRAAAASTPFCRMPWRWPSRKRCSARTIW